MNIQAIYENARKYHDSMMPLWNKCTKYAFPSTANEQIYDSTVANAVDKIASTLSSLLTPNTKKWFVIKDKGTDSINHDITNQVWQLLKCSNFYNAIHQSYLELITLGTSCVSIISNDFNKQSIYFEVPGMKNIMIYETNNIRAAIRKIDEDEYEMMLYNTLNKQLEKYYINHLSDKNIELKKQPLLSQDAINNTLIYKWKQLPNEIYGISPVMQNMPDIEINNSIKKLLVQHIELNILGVWQMDEDGVMDGANIQIRPGEIIPKSPNSKGLTPLQFNNTFSIADDMLQNLGNKIDKAISCNIDSVNRTQGLTATEIEESIAEKYQKCSAISNRFQNTLIRPLITRILTLLFNRGAIKTKIANLNIETLSPVSEKIKNKDMQQKLSNISQVCSIDKKAKSHIDTADLIRDIMNENT